MSYSPHLNGPGRRAVEERRAEEVWGVVTLLEGATFKGSSWSLDGVWDSAWKLSTWSLSALLFLNDFVPSHPSWKHLGGWRFRVWFWRSLQVAKHRSRSETCSLFKQSGCEHVYRDSSWVFSCFRNLEPVAKDLRHSRWEQINGLVPGLQCTSAWCVRRSWFFRNSCEHISHYPNASIIGDSHSRWKHNKHWRYTTAQNLIFRHQRVKELTVKTASYIL